MRVSIVVWLRSIWSHFLGSLRERNEETVFQAMMSSVVLNVWISNNVETKLRKNGKICLNDELL